jgi:predicted nuclease with TOPRIM domain
LKILQQHNRELIQLSAKFDKIEQENGEFKRKIAHQASAYQTMNDNISQEKASTTALKAANEQLLAKIHELQKNIDIMSIELIVNINIILFKNIISLNTPSYCIPFNDYVESTQLRQADIFPLSSMYSLTISMYST